LSDFKLNAVNQSSPKPNGVNLNAVNRNVIGILGGTFDPVHLGHVALAEAALAQLPLAEVLWMPSGSPGHRASPVASAHDRLAMLRLATEGHPRYRIDAAELESSEPTYTVHTLTRLRAQLGKAQPLVLLLGADSFLSLPTWLRWRELFDLAHIVVVARPGTVLEGTLPAPLAAEWSRRLHDSTSALRATPAGAIIVQPITPHDVSASAIRAALARGAAGAAAVRGLLPPAVLAYIERNRLYQPHTDAT